VDKLRHLFGQYGKEWARHVRIFEDGRELLGTDFVGGECHDALSFQKWMTALSSS